MNRVLRRICSLNSGNVTRMCFTLLLWGFISLSSQSVSVRVTCDEGKKFIGLWQAFFHFGSRSESTISCVEISMHNYRFFKRLFLHFCDITDAAVTLWLREGITTTKTKVPEGTWISEMKFFIFRVTFIDTPGRQIFVFRSGIIFLLNINKSNYLKNLIENKWRSDVTTKRIRERSSNLC